MNLLISLLGRKDKPIFQSVKDPCRFAAEEMWIKCMQGLLADQRIKGIFSVIADGYFFFMMKKHLKS